MSFQVKFNKKTVAMIIFELAFAILSMIASQYVVGFPLIWILGNNFNQPIWTLVYYILSYALALWMVLWLAPKLWEQVTHRDEMNTNKEELGIDKWPTFVDIGLAPIGYVVYLVGARILTSLMEILPWFNSEEAQDVGFSYLGGFCDKIIAFIAIVVVAPLAEELIMRGWLYGKFAIR